MNQRWALQLHGYDAALAGRLRLLPAVEVCVHGDQVWLRGPYDDEAQRLLRLFPAGKQFVVLEDLQLVPRGGAVPQGKLPNSTWLPLERWLALGLPTAKFPARADHKVKLAIVRNACQREANLLLTNWDCWSAYALAAPVVRLRCWSFAVAEDECVLVRGIPLPPLPGIRYVEEQGVAAPAGYHWSPAIEAVLLRELLSLAPLDVALWQTDGSWEYLGAGDFVQATRSAVRQSVPRATHG